MESAQIAAGAKNIPSSDGFAPPVVSGKRGDCHLEPIRFAVQIVHGSSDGLSPMGFPSFLLDRLDDSIVERAGLADFESLVDGESDESRFGNSVVVA